MERQDLLCIKCGKYYSEEGDWCWICYLKVGYPPYQWK
jgi:hypothetical protein